MKIIILAGDNKKHNKIWNEKISKSLNESLDTSVHSLHYYHWETFEQETMNLDLELDRLTQIIGKEKEYIICAKTAGILITLKGIYEGRLNPSKCIFMGMPIIWARLNNYQIDKWLSKNNDIETLVIQKESDPAMYCDELENYLEEKKLSNIKLIKISGTDMYYEDYDILPQLINNFISNSIESK